MTKRQLFPLRGEQDSGYKVSMMSTWTWWSKVWWQAPEKRRCEFIAFPQREAPEIGNRCVQKKCRRTAFWRIPRAINDFQEIDTKHLPPCELLCKIPGPRIHSDSPPANAIHRDNALCIKYNPGTFVEMPLNKEDVGCSKAKKIENIKRMWAMQDHLYPDVANILAAAVDAQSFSSYGGVGHFGWRVSAGCRGLLISIGFECETQSVCP